MQAIWAWAAATQTGDRGELPFVPQADEWESLDADADDCVGEFCEHFRDCWFFKKRDEAKYADIVVVNHALFFLDLAIGGGCCRHTTSPCWTKRINASAGPRTRSRRPSRARPSTGCCENCTAVTTCRRISTSSSMRGCAAWNPRSRGWRRTLSAARQRGRRARDGCVARRALPARNWITPIGTKPSEATGERSRGRPPARSGDALGRGPRRRDRSRANAGRGIHRLGRTRRADGRYAVRCAPFDVAHFLQATLFDRTQSVVLTSATLSVAGSSFEFLKRSLGLNDAQELVAPSPFSYAEQARLFHRTGRRQSEATQLRTQGRAAGRGVPGPDARPRVRPVHVLRAPARSLRARARAHSVPDARARRRIARAPARLVPEDARGGALCHVDVLGGHRRGRRPALVRHHRPAAVPSPGDPLVEARIRALESRGLSGFENYMIPAATVRLNRGSAGSFAARAIAASSRCSTTGRLDPLRRDDSRRASAREAHRTLGRARRFPHVA